MQEISKPDFDTIVIGGGIAGFSTAKALNQHGLNVVVIEQNQEPPEKSLFINGDNRIPPDLIEQLSIQKDFIPCPNFLLVNADFPNRNLQAQQRTNNTYAAFHKPIIDYIRRKSPINFEIILDTVTESEESPDKIKITLSNGRTFTSNTIVDATGNNSHLSRMHSTKDQKSLLSDDPFVLWVKGIRGYGSFQPDQLIDPVGRSLGLSWVLPYSADYGDIVAADYCRISELNARLKEQRLQNLIDFCRVRGLCEVKQEEYTFSSFIRCEPIPKIAVAGTKRLYAVGEAAGMGSPLMAEVVPAAFYWGNRLADFIAQGKTPTEFYQQWRIKQPIFPYDIEFAMLKRRLKREATGEYGSNALIYQALMKHLPKAVQRDVLTHRSLPFKYWPYFLCEVLQNPGLIPNLTELSLELVKVKLNNLRSN